MPAGDLDALSPLNWETYPCEPPRSAIFAGTFRALSEIVRALGGIAAASVREVLVKGGPIVAWGKTDIYDHKSELHRRFEIGVTSNGRFHSVDPGKLTMAPYFAEVCAAHSPVRMGRRGDLIDARAADHGRAAGLQRRRACPQGA